METTQDRRIAQLEKEIGELRGRVWGMTFQNLYFTFAPARAWFLILILIAGVAKPAARIG